MYGELCLLMTAQILCMSFRHLCFLSLRLCCRHDVAPTHCTAHRQREFEVVMVGAVRSYSLATSVSLCRLLQEVQKALDAFQAFRSAKGMFLRLIHITADVGCSLTANLHIKKKSLEKTQQKQKQQKVPRAVPFPYLPWNYCAVVRLCAECKTLQNSSNTCRVSTRHVTSLSAFHYKDSPPHKSHLSRHPTRHRILCHIICLACSGLVHTAPRLLFLSSLVICQIWGL